MEINALKSQRTEESMVDTVRKHRNDLIKDFLDERHLKSYVSEHFGIRDLTPIKLEFIKKDLKELLIAPVDLHHYAPVLSHLRMADGAGIEDDHERLFYRELDGVFKRYIYQ